MKRATPGHRTPIYRWMACLVALCGGWSVDVSADSPREYRRILLSDPIDLDPARLEDVNALQIMLQVAEGLVSLQENVVRPAIAERWEISPDQRQYTFHLDTAARFGDGTAITAADVIRSYEYLVAKESLVWRELSIIAGASEYHHGKAKHVGGIELIDAQTVRFTLAKPFAPFLEIIAVPPFVILPEPSLALLHVAHVAPFVGSGPYQLVGYQHGRSLQLDRNPHYHGADQVYFDRIVYDVVRSPLLAKAGFFGGLYADIWPVFIREISLPLATVYEKVPAYSASTWYLEFNLTRPAVANSGLRRFIASHLDRGAFLRALQLPDHFAATRFIPRGLVGHRTRSTAAMTEEAERLLAQAQCQPRRPCRIELLYEKNVEAALEGLLRPITESYADRVQIVLQKLERHAWYERFVTGRYEMLFLGNNPRYVDAYSLLNYLMMERYHPGLRREAIQRNLDRAFETSDRVARGEIYAAVDDALLGQDGVIPIYHGVVPYLWVRRGYVGHSVSILGPEHLAMRQVRVRQ